MPSAVYKKKLQCIILHIHKSLLLLNANLSCFCYDANTDVVPPRGGGLVVFGPEIPKFHSLFKSHAVYLSLQNPSQNCIKLTVSALANNESYTLFENQWKKVPPLRVIIQQSSAQKSARQNSRKMSRK